MEDTAPPAGAPLTPAERAEQIVHHRLNEWAYVDNADKLHVRRHVLARLIQEAIEEAVREANRQSE